MFGGQERHESTLYCDFSCLRLRIGLLRLIELFYSEKTQPT